MKLYKNTHVYVHNSERDTINYQYLLFSEIIENM